MALLDDELNPRLSTGKIGGPPTVHPPQLSMGQIGGPPTVRRFPNVQSAQPSDHSGEFMGRTRNVLEQGGADVREAYQRGGLAPALGMLARASTAGPLAVLDDLTPDSAGIKAGLGTFLTGKVPTAAAPGSKGPVAVEDPSVVPTGSTPVQSAAEKAAVRGPSVPARQVPGTNGVTRIDLAGKSPLFTNLDPEAAVSQMSGNPIGVIPAGASPFGGGSAGGELSAALQAAAARGDWGAVQQHYQRNGGTWQGKTAAQEGAGGTNILEWDKLIDADKVQEARGKLLESLTNVQPGRNGLSKNQATLLMQLLGQNQQGGQAQAEMALRAKQQADTLGIQQGNLAVAQQQAGTHSLTSLLQAALAGNQLEDSKELRALRQQFQAGEDARGERGPGAEDPGDAGQGSAARPRRDAEARAALFGDAVKGASSGMMAGPDGKALTLDQLLAQGQQFMAGTSAAAAPQTLAAGQVVDGYRFKGGDPKKESSWEAVQ